VPANLRGVARPRQARRHGVPGPGLAWRHGGLGLGRGSAGWDEARCAARRRKRRRAEAEMNEEESPLVLKLPNFRRMGARPPKITHYFWRPCQRPPKIRPFSVAVPVVIENRLIFGGS
jgi:hypothetical protein